MIVLAGDRTFEYMFRSPAQPFYNFSVLKVADQYTRFKFLAEHHCLMRYYAALRRREGILLCTENQKHQLILVLVFNSILL